VFVGLFGSSETALRAFPFLCGSASLVLFAYVAEEMLPPFGAVVSVALLAINHRLVYFSSEVKPYGVDAAVAILLVALGLELLRQPLRPARVAACALLGTVAGWFSFPACYGLAAIVAALLVSAWRRRDRRVALFAISLLVWWPVSVLPGLLVAQGRLEASNSRVLAHFWGGGYPPTGGSARDVSRWLASTLGSEITYLFEEHAFSWRLSLITVVLLLGALVLARLGLRGRPQLGFLVSGLAIVALVGGAMSHYPFTGRLSLGKLLFAVFLGLTAVGSASLARRRPELLVLILGPILLALAGAVARGYPLKGRLSVFLIPFLLLLLGEGIGILGQIGRPRVVVLAGGAVAALLIGGAISATLARFPEDNEELRPVLEKMMATARPGDTVYLHHGSARPFEYYETRMSIPRFEVVRGCCAINQWPRLVDALLKLEGRPRVWLIVSHHWDPSEPAFLFDTLDRVGKRLAAFQVPSAAACLYDLSRIDRAAVGEVLAAIPADRRSPTIDWICAAGPDSESGCPQP
jgi:hypothetical protein